VEKEKKDHGKSADPFTAAYSDLLEKVNELSLVCNPTCVFKAFILCEHDLADVMALVVCPDSCRKLMRLGKKRIGHSRPL
jgi:hypothetical protein